MPAARMRTKTSAGPTDGASICCSSSRALVAVSRIDFIVAVALWATFEVTRTHHSTRCASHSDAATEEPRLPELHEMFAGQLLHQLLQFETKKRRRNGATRQLRFGRNVVD